MKKWFLSGNLPYLTTAILCIAAFFVGQMTVRPESHFAVAEKGAVIVEAVLGRPGRTAQEIEREVKQPILAVVKSYADRGFTVIDASRDEQGDLAIVALPRDTIDITGELRAAILKATPGQQKLGTEGVKR